MPNVLSAIWREGRAAQRLTEQYKPDLIISDSRFGFRSSQVRSVVITHQLTLQSPSRLLGAAMNAVNARLLNAFDECWIPDDPQLNLSGQLSTNPRITNQRHIGILSRMKKRSSIHQRYDLCIILSGPEPARTRLEAKLVKLYGQEPLSVCLIRGTARPRLTALPEHWTVMDRADSAEVNEALLSSARVISRSGYSSIMDYVQLGIAAELIPTPGQTEQEYLAEHLEGKWGMQKWKGI